MRYNKTMRFGPRTLAAEVRGGLRRDVYPMLTVAVELSLGSMIQNHAFTDRRRGARKSGLAGGGILPWLLAALAAWPGVQDQELRAAEPAPAFHGISSSPHPFEEVQPDGTRITLHIRGDESFHWLEDREGFTVVKDRGAYVYAQKNTQGDLIPSSLWVGRADPVASGLKRRVLPAAEALRPRGAGFQPMSTAEGEISGSATFQAAGAIGTTKNLVILIRFSNHIGRTLPSQSDFSTIFNAVGGDPVLAPTGSVRDYYLETSYGKLTLNSTVIGWIDLPQTEQYYADGSSGLNVLIYDAIKSALESADALVDFSQFDDDNNLFIDSIAFVHSGYGAEWGGTDVDGSGTEDRIWSHRSSIPTWTSDEGVRVRDYHINPGLWGLSGSAPGRIGVICHETGHFFGLPDLYDTVGSGEGIGSYGLMANSWGFDGSQLHPPHMSAWSKIELGWISPTVISSPGVYLAPQSQTNEVIYRINNGYPSEEYLLIENRQPVGFETSMPQGGLVMYHIDDLAGYDTEGYPGQPGWPQNGNHYRVALLQADGKYDLEQANGRGDGGDVFHGDGRDFVGSYTVPMTNAYQGGNVLVTHNRIDQISASGENMTFRYSDLGPAVETSRLGNIATRARVQTGEEVMIGGFIIDGPTTKTVVVRAIGPTLTDFGVPDALSNPTLQLFSGQTPIGFNDDWDDTQATEIQALGLAPNDHRESAILVALPSGPYTAIVRGRNDTRGVGLVEVFDVGEGEASSLVNIATRGIVLTEANVMIGGFIINGDSPKTVMVRAIGPNLSNYGVIGALQDPVLQIFSGPNRIAQNDDWQSGFQSVEIAEFNPPAESLESAVMMTLAPGPYTAIVSGFVQPQGALTGVALVEVYAVEP